MRGKVDLSAQVLIRKRITPAYAGKRHFLRNIRRHNWDHPRLCGEKRKLYASGYSYTGSPPPMRGKVFGCPALTHKSRITPAYAGKSKCKSQSFAPVQDHPRLCGEKLTNRRILCIIVGSPPPMRGKVSRSAFSRSAAAGSPPPMRGKVAPSTPKRKTMRITPAYAGKSTQH